MYCARRIPAHLRYLLPNFLTYLSVADIANPDLCLKIATYNKTLRYKLSKTYTIKNMINLFMWYIRIQSVYVIHFGQRSLCILNHVTHTIL